MPWKKRIEKFYSGSHWLLDEKTKPYLTQTITQTVAAVRFVWSSPFINRKYQEITRESWEGIKASFRWRDFQKLLGLSRKKTEKHRDEDWVLVEYHPDDKAVRLRELLRDSFYVNMICYAGSAVVYEGAVKPLVNWILFSAGFSSLENSWSDYVVSRFLFSFAVGAAIKNIYYMAQLGEETTKLLTPVPELKSCGCSKDKLIKADADSLIYYPRNMMTAKFASWMPGFLGYLGTAAQAMVYGQCMMEYRLASDGSCTEHRVVKFTQNNPYAFVYGASLILSAKMASRLLTFLAFGLQNYFLKTAISLQNDYVEDAVFNMLFQIYMIFALMQNQPLPGKSGWLDLFELNRDEMNKIRDRFVTWFVTGMGSKENRDTLIQYAKNILSYPPLKVMGFFVLAPGLFPVSAFWKDPKKMFSRKIMEPEVLLTVPELAALIKKNNSEINMGVSIAKFARSTSWLVSWVPSYFLSSNLKGSYSILGSVDSAILDQIARLPITAKRLTEKSQIEEVRLHQEIKPIEKYVAKKGKNESGIEVERIRMEYGDHSVRCDAKISVVEGYDVTSPEPLKKSVPVPENKKPLDREDQDKGWLGVESHSPVVEAQEFSPVLHRSSSCSLLAKPALARSASDSLLCLRGIFRAPTAEAEKTIKALPRLKLR